MFVFTSGDLPAREPGGRVGIGREIVQETVWTRRVFLISYFVIHEDITAGAILYQPRYEATQLGATVCFPEVMDSNPVEGACIFQVSIKSDKWFNCPVQCEDRFYLP